MSLPAEEYGRRGNVDSPSGRWSSSEFLQTVTFMLLDVAIVWVATIIAYFVRFEGNIPEDFPTVIATTALVASVIFPTLFVVFGLYGYIWRYVGVPALFRLGWVTILGIAVLLIGDLLLTSPAYGRPIPFGVLLILGVLLYMGFFGVRIFGRLVSYVQMARASTSGSNVIIVGAGDAGSLLQRDIESNRGFGIRVAGFVDDDPQKQGKMLGGKRVLGSVDEIPRLAEENAVESIYVAVPSASPDQMRRILYACGQTKLPVRIVPALATKRGKLGLYDLADVTLEDFLGREQVVTDLATIRASLAGRRVLVTGAAGSIGSELCRQIASFGPAKLIMLEIDESRLYEVYLEIRDIAPGAAWMSLCDIRSRRKLAKVFDTLRPQVVVHAAAYKHVPLMELEPDEAVMTNVRGTLNVLELSASHDVEDFVLISTDKAVQPTSVMGATKRVAEKMAFAVAESGLPVTVVRFGNVLGSRGSVLPIFDSALRRGDSVRVTHPDVERYFMTISEAVQLVLQARVLSNGADLFVLDMGEPVRVLDLAQAIIDMRGGHATLEFTGLRPAEKLSEILVSSEEELLPTSCEKVLRSSAVPFAPPGYMADCARVADLVADVPPQEVREMMATLVPEYTGASVS